MANKTPPISSSSSSPSNVAAQSTVVANLQEIKYKGVRLRKWGKYVSEIRLPNSRERIWLGSYDTAEKAARAFDAALFCLRGHNAKFNFPDDPPNIAGGQSLTPGMIQAVAQQYANSYSAGGPGSDHQLNMDDGDADFRVIRAMELDHDTSPSSEAGASDQIDWSFLDKLGSNNNTGHFMDFGLFHEPGDMYMPPHYHEGHVNDDNYHDDDIEHGNGGGVQSFDLWSF